MIRKIHYSNFQSCLSYGILLWDGDNETNKLFKLHEDGMAKNLDIHNHNMQRKLNLHVQHCNTVLFKKIRDKYGNRFVGLQ
jgi:hypothetical protein